MKKVIKMDALDRMVWSIIKVITFALLIVFLLAGLLGCSTPNYNPSQAIPSVKVGELPHSNCPISSTMVCDN